MAAARPVLTFASAGVLHTTGFKILETVSDGRSIFSPRRLTFALWLNQCLWVKVLGASWSKASIRFRTMQGGAEVRDYWFRGSKSGSTAFAAIKQGFWKSWALLECSFHCPTMRRTTYCLEADGIGNGGIFLLPGAFNLDILGCLHSKTKHGPLYNSSANFA